MPPMAASTAMKMKHQQPVNAAVSLVFEQIKGNLIGYKIVSILHR